MAFLELRSLSKSYGDNWAVHDVTLAVERGEVLSLLGPSGCGKTTTLNMIAGFIRPTSGTILLDGQSLDGVALEKRDTAMVFQSYALFPHMTVEQNVRFGLEMRGIGREQRDARVGGALDLVGLRHLGDRFPAQISGGQQQRVALARALVLEPKVLLLDEPLSNLDAKLRQEMRVELRRIQKRVGITTVFVTHDQEEALAISDRIAVIHAGRVEQVGTPVEIYEHPASLFVANFIGETNVFAAVAEAATDERLIARAPGLPLIEAPGRPGIRSGDAVRILVRPERIRLSHAPEGPPNRLTARVSEVTYVGNRTHVRMGMDGTDVSLAVHVAGQRGSEIPALGETRAAWWDPRDTTILPVEP